LIRNCLRKRNGSIENYAAQMHFLNSLFRNKFDRANGNNINANKRMDKIEEKKYSITKLENIHA
jgi:hypothetical protein